MPLAIPSLARIPRRLAVAAAALALTVWPEIGQPEDAWRMEVFTMRSLPVGGLSDIGVRDVTVYRVDGLAALLAELSLDLPGNPEAARAEALRRLGALDAEDVARAREAVEGLVRAAEYGIVRYPAVVMDGRYLVYGVTHLPQALARAHALAGRSGR